MPYGFNFLGKGNKHTHYGHLCVSKCPCMDWNKKTHKLWSFVSKCPCMDCSFLQNTTSVAIFWYSWYFCGYFVYLQPHKTDSHTGKKTPKFMDKSSHKTPFCGSVRPSVCGRHGFRSISQVCFGISISIFICMLMVAIGRSLLIFSDVTFKMATLWPYWIFWFPDSNFTLALNINFKLQWHNIYVWG